MLLSLNECYLLHECLNDCMLKHRMDESKCKTINGLMEKVWAEAKKIEFKYDFAGARERANAFEGKYYSERNSCPLCHSREIGPKTYLGYVVVIKEDGTVDESFKDENLVECKCGFKGTFHELLP